MSDDGDGVGSGGAATDREVSRDASPVEALLEVAPDGVSFDGLEVDRDEDGYHFRVPETKYRGLSAGEFEEAARRHGEYVEDWYFWHALAPQDPARWAFLRWVERADERSVPDRRDRLQGGTSRQWGELSVAVRLAERGRRVYEIRHQDDVDERVEELDVYTDPYAARRLRKADDDGRYRPLSTAPTLQHGWVFVDLDPGEAAQTVEGFYPATVANWHREREGELDVTHWHEAVSRQTGIYGVVETWDRGEGHEHVEWVAEACCVDSQCLKRREWEYDAETPLSVDGGDGVFPCREPCSLVVAAARRWTRLESEESRTYEFELTPSEKEQIEEMIDAVAEGRTDEIREADTAEGANRYRARFLRAKRFDDDGNLCGVPTDRGDDPGGGDS